MGLGVDSWFIFNNHRQFLPPMIRPAGLRPSKPARAPWRSKSEGSGAPSGSAGVSPASSALGGRSVSPRYGSRPPCRWERPGPAEAESWRHCRSSRVGERGGAVPVLCGRDARAPGDVPTCVKPVGGRIVFQGGDRRKKSSRQRLARPACPGSVVPSRACPPSGRPRPSGRRFGIPGPAPRRWPSRWLPLPAASRRNT